MRLGSCIWRPSWWEYASGGISRPQETDVAGGAAWRWLTGRLFRKSDRVEHKWLVHLIFWFTIGDKFFGLSLNFRCCPGSGESCSSAILVLNKHFSIRKTLLCRPISIDFIIIIIPNRSRNREIMASLQFSYSSSNFYNNIIINKSSYMDQVLISTVSKNWYLCLGREFLTGHCDSIGSMQRILFIVRQKDFWNLIYLSSAVILRFYWFVFRYF